MNKCFLLGVLLSALATSAHANPPGPHSDPPAFLPAGLAVASSVNNPVYYSNSPLYWTWIEGSDNPRWRLILSRSYFFGLALKDDQGVVKQGWFELYPDREVDELNDGTFHPRSAKPTQKFYDDLKPQDAPGGVWFLTHDFVGNNSDTYLHFEWRPIGYDPGSSNAVDLSVIEENLGSIAEELSSLENLDTLPETLSLLSTSLDAIRATLDREPEPIRYEEIIDYLREREQRVSVLRHPALSRYVNAAPGFSRVASGASLSQTLIRRGKHSRALRALRKMRTDAIRNRAKFAY